jgi:hypothetical protein
VMLVRIISQAGMGASYAGWGRREYGRE